MLPGDPPSLSGVASVTQQALPQHKARRGVARSGCQRVEEVREEQKVKMSQSKRKKSEFKRAVPNKSKAKYYHTCTLGAKPYAEVRAVRGNKVRIVCPRCGHEEIHPSTAMP